VTLFTFLSILSIFSPHSSWPLTATCHADLPTYLSILHYIMYAYTQPRMS